MGTTGVEMGPKPPSLERSLNTFWGEMDETADELESQVVVSNNRGLSIQTKFDWFWIRALGLPLQL